MPVDIAAAEHLRAQTPIRWPLADGRPFTEHRVETSSISVALEPGGEIAASVSGGPSVRILVDERLGRGQLRIDHGFMTQASWSSQEGGLDRFVELFAGSAIVSVFQRAWGGSELQPIRGYRLQLPPQLDQVHWFFGDEKVVGDMVEVELEPGRTTKPFVVYADDEDTQGVVLYLPHRPELRRWSVEHYTVPTSTTVRLTPRRAKGGLRVDVGFGQIELPADESLSFDAPLFVMPYVGRVEDALRELELTSVALVDDRPPVPGAEDGYWEPYPTLPQSRILPMSRYAPQEFASWIPSEDLWHGVPGGFAWGDLTKTMKGLRLDPLALRSLQRDHAFRTLVFFLEAGRDKGAPPNLIYVDKWARLLSDPSQIRSVVFCQYWEFRLAEFERLLDSKLVSEEARGWVYRELQQARIIFDPDSPSTWSTRTKNGGLWFDYFDLPLWKDNAWIINTHATSVINAGRFARLAKRMSDAEGFEFWEEMFRRGLDGMFHATGQPWMWQDEDPNELRYGRVDGPRRYHDFMLSAWVPELLELADELSPSHVPPLLDLLDRLARSRHLRDSPELLERAAQIRARYSARAGRM